MSVRLHQVSNPPSPFLDSHVDYEGEAPAAKLEVYEEKVRSAIVENESPDVPFRYGVNPYRGCFHGCAYCYARPYHQYVGFGAGTDFERRIVVKTNIAEALRRDLSRRTWKGDLIAFSGITDCYQPLEAAYRLTRACLEVCLERANPVGIITKSSVVRRDVDLLAMLERDAGCRVTLSIPFADDELGRAIEPWASPIAKRFETLRVLSEAGIPTGVGIAPLIPGLNDSSIPEILERAREAGATRAFMMLLRLPREVHEIFHQRIEAVLPPERVKRIRNAIREVRGGVEDETRFGARMRGIGPRYEAIEQLFVAQRKRLGMEGDDDAPPARRVPRGKQLTLFE